MRDHHREARCDGGEHLLTRRAVSKDIADKLSISEETVKRHLTIIFDKTGMSTRLELAMYAVKHGIGN